MTSLEQGASYRLLTPAGRGAVATIAVWGDGAEAAADRWFEPAFRKTPLSQTPIGRIVFGRWSQGAGEEIVACRRAAGRVELHCHGGFAACEQILQGLAKVGCQHLQDGSAFPTENRLQHEARHALSQAPTQRVASILLAQYRGALQNAILDVLQKLEQQQYNSARQTLCDLLQKEAVGLHLTQPWRIVLAGRPNVGKSSLLNALVGYQRSLAHDQPGVTRDVVTASANWDGWPLELADTAGLRDSDDELEAAGVQRTQTQIGNADLVVIVADASQPWTAYEQRLLETAEKSVIAHNKSDLAPPPWEDRPEGIAVCATEAEGVEPLLQSITGKLIPEPPSGAVPFTERQFHRLLRAAEHLGIRTIAEAKREVKSLLE